MKLVLCLECQDVFKLAVGRTRSCTCGKCSGRYLEDRYHAEISGESAIPIGFNNKSLVAALRKQPNEGMGQRFEAFVIPKECATILVKE